MYTLLGRTYDGKVRLCRYVIEVNRSPSYGATSDLDREVKSGVIKSTMKLLKPSAGKKRATVSTTRERSRARLFASDGGMSMKPRRATRGVGGNRSGVSVDKAILDALEKKRCEWEDANCGQFHRIFPVESSSHPWEGMSKAVAPSAKIEVAAKRYVHQGFCRASMLASAVPVSTLYTADNIFYHVVHPT